MARSWGKHQERLVSPAEISTPPDTLFPLDHCGRADLTRTTRREFSDPRLWLIVEYLPGASPFQQWYAPPIGLMTRPEAVRLLERGIFSRLPGAGPYTIATGIVGRPCVPLYDSCGRLVWWHLLARHLPYNQTARAAGIFSDFRKKILIYADRVLQSRWKEKDDGR